MSSGQWLAAGLVLLVAALIFRLGWSSCQWRADRAADRRQRAADQRTAAARGLEVAAELRAPLPTYAGWVYGTRWADWRGAQDRQYQAGIDAYGNHWDGHAPAVSTAPMSVISAMEMADAAYQLGQDRANADQARAETEAIWAEVEAHPEQWRHQ